MRRGDLVTVAVSGDYGKPRPAVVVTADALLDIGRLNDSDLHRLNIALAFTLGLSG